DDRGRKVKAFLYRKRPSLRYTRIPELVKKAADKRDVQKHQRYWITRTFGDSFVPGKKIIHKGGNS
ncbi:MAG: hypothetical protein JWP44_741, partial [Mucilaginibacter sp.]|nr:hypothetical protein [Mucilaginibacter sp.]